MVNQASMQQGPRTFGSWGLAKRLWAKPLSLRAALQGLQSPVKLLEAIGDRLQRRSVAMWASPPIVEVRHERNAGGYRDDGNKSNGVTRIFLEVRLHPGNQSAFLS